MHINNFLNSKKTNDVIKFDKIFEQGCHHGRYKQANKGTERCTTQLAIREM